MRPRERDRGDVFLFNARAYLADPVVLRMTLEERGAYSTLLFALWDLPEPGVVEDNDRVLSRLAGATPEEWAHVKAAVSGAFDTTGRAGWWVQKRMVRTHLDQVTWARGQSRSGRKGGLASATKRSTSKQALSEPQATLEGSVERASTGYGSGLGSGSESLDLNPSTSVVPPTAPRPEKPAAPPPRVVLMLPTNRKDQDYAVTADFVADLIPLYPAVDVPAQIREMRGWLLTNANNRKTAGGTPRFINRWLAKEQNRARNNSAPEAAGLLPPEEAVARAQRNLERWRKDNAPKKHVSPDPD